MLAELYTEQNFYDLARLLVRVWGAREAAERVPNMVRHNPRGVRLAAEVDRLQQQEAAGERV